MVGHYALYATLSTRIDRLVGDIQLIKRRLDLVEAWLKTPIFFLSISAKSILAPRPGPPRPARGRHGQPSCLPRARISASRP
jgi:hypothetical protein